MREDLYKKWEFDHRRRQVLERAVFGPTSPGNLLADMEALLVFVAEKPVPLSQGLQVPSRNVLTAINARFVRPLQHRFVRPGLKSFPHIMGLYLLARASELTQVAGTSARPLLELNRPVLESWLALTPLERYMELLCAWLLRAVAETVGERSSVQDALPDASVEWDSLYRRIPDEGLPVAGNREEESYLRYSPGWHNLALMELFGLLRVETGPPVDRQGWQIASIHRTPLGDALLGLLHQQYPADRPGWWMSSSAYLEPLQNLPAVLRSVFPAWQRDLLRVEHNFRPGLYVFRLTWYDVWRRMAIPADKPLDALADLALDSVEFEDRDHLYCFRFRTPLGIPAEVLHPFMEDGPWTHDVRVGDVPLAVGHTMVFFFDYGDNWEFGLTLERIEPAAGRLKPALLDGAGLPPQQYRYWDEEE